MSFRSEVLEKAGVVGSDLAAVDWAGTPLGDPDHWPLALRNAVRILLTSKFSMWMAWGEELTFFCNDAYRRDTLGAKYPWALGRPASEVWSEIWDDIGPRIEHVLRTGEATFDQRLLLFLERSGFTEETYHTFSYSPLTDEDGAIAGMLCVVKEDTEEVIAARRMATLRDLGERLSGLDEQESIAAACAHLGANDKSLPFTLVYLFEPDGHTARLACASGFAAGADAAPARLEIDGDGPWPLAAVLRGETVEVDLAGTDGLPTGAWSVPPRVALAVPLLHPTQPAPYGAFVAGMNPHHAVDDDSLGFVQLIASHLAARITDARTYEFERQRAETLAALDQAKTDFFTNVSHEFRTPLTLLLGPAEESLADEDEPLGPAQRRRLEVVHRNGQRLLKLVNSLLDFSRLEAKGAQSRFEPVDLARYTRDLAAMFESAAQGAGLELVIDCPPLPAPVFVDQEHWAKIVLNLISNALKFTFTGTIGVALRASDGRAELSVRDTGVGIPDDQLEHLFTRFHRVRDTAARTHEGSGIGLALVAELAELHGGAVSVTSTLGEGSTFTVALPFGSAHLPVESVVHDDASTQARDGELDDQAGGFLSEVLRWLPAPAPAPLPETTPGSRVEGPRVLVVDDNADMREYVAGLLAEDYVVERAVDGLDALERIGRARPDLVLTDVMMPNMDGFGLLERLRADPMTVEIPVVMVSARAGEDGVVEGLDAGADDYLVKPFSARELRARVRVNLELHRVRQAVRQEVEERERAIADQLQRSLLPAASFELEHLELATYYAPGVVGTQVGGDWYDVIEISPVRTALVIGDVMGRGVAAASVMGQLRSAVRALARLDIPPGELVGELDGIVQELGRSQIVTCFYAVFDAHQRVLTYASAGHMPLFVVGADGVIHRSTAAGPPLGAGSTGQTTQQHELAEGDTVVLYTDGLVERRDQDVMAGLHALERELATAAYEPASELPRLLAGRLMPEGPEDDVAVLVARVRGEAYRASRWHYLALTPRLAAEARGQVDAQLGEWGLPAAFRADVALVVSELVTNAYRHGGPPIEHRVVHTGRSVVVEVADGSPIRPTPRSVTPREEAGRGLAIIARLADRWGSRAAGTGKVVWASLRPERQEDSR